jgi:hypothetical protein
MSIRLPRMGLGPYVAISVFGLSILASPALAGIAPPELTMDITIFSKEDTKNPIYQQVVTPTNTGPVGPPGSHAWGFDVLVFHPSFSISGDVNASPTTSPVPAFINPTLNFANNTADSLWFLISINMPTAHEFGLPLGWSTSASWTLTGPNPMLSTLEDTPLWSVGADGTQVGSLFPDPVVMDNDNLNISDATSGMFASPVLDSMSIDLAFKLSPNAVGGVNGMFQTVVPAPGVLMLAGVGGLIGTTRRRRMDR